MFSSKTYNNNDKPWKSSGIVRAKCLFYIFPIFSYVFFERCPPFSASDYRTTNTKKMEKRRICEHQESNTCSVEKITGLRFL